MKESLSRGCVTESKLSLLCSLHDRPMNLGDKVSGQRIRLYLESQQTEKMADECLRKTILSGSGCQFLLQNQRGRGGEEVM